VKNRIVWESLDSFPLRLGPYLPCLIVDDHPAVWLWRSLPHQSPRAGKGNLRNNEYALCALQKPHCSCVTRMTGSNWFIFQSLFPRRTCVEGSWRRIVHSASTLQGPASITDLHRQRFAFAELRWGQNRAGWSSPREFWQVMRSTCLNYCCILHTCSLVLFLSGYPVTANSDQI
jgi:hypothetical protein